MITITKLCKSAKEMEILILDYFRQFAPAGYGTTAKIKVIQSYEMWKNQQINYEVTLERLESCD